MTAGTRIAGKVIRKAEVAGRGGPVAATITLDRASRYRRRLRMRADDGLAFLLDLAEPTYLADGDALALDDGRLVVVCAADEDLLEVRANDLVTLARIAWHVGNRHTPCEVAADALYIQPDHVLAAMIEGLGGRVRPVRRPFEPEGGAYGGKGPLTAGHHHHSHSHDHHGHGHGHADQEHAHGDGGARAAPRAAVWRPDGA